MQKSARIAEL